MRKKKQLMRHLGGTTVRVSNLLLGTVRFRPSVDHSDLTGQEKDTRFDSFVHCAAQIRVSAVGLVRSAAPFISSLHPPTYSYGEHIEAVTGLTFYSHFSLGKWRDRPCIKTYF